ncbi:MAG: hypothetical protein IKY13_06270 [Bacteroidaceae bacterium]|nr:hypothetical protein [Bacteroidaceae bacterium]
MAQIFDNNTFTPHFGAAHLVRGYHISGHKAPQPVLRTPFDGNLLRAVSYDPRLSTMRYCKGRSQERVAAPLWCAIW